MMRMRMLGLLGVALLAACAPAGGGRTMTNKQHDTISDTFTLWQLPSQTPSQMMGYVIRTAGGRVIVIDGGTPGDAPYLRGFIAALGNTVDAWFMTHTHDDHCGALTEILGNHDGPWIKAVYHSLPDDEWVKKNSPVVYQEAHHKYVRALQASGVPASELTLGQEFNLDGVRIEVLGVKNPELTMNDFNNQSCVFRVSDRHKSVLFLGDLGIEAGEKMLKNSRDRLPVDIVQMAHHGQNGVTRDVYEAIHAKAALWPTPLWLWDNNSGKGKGSGPWKTLETRQWMEELGVRKNYVAVEGLIRID